LDNQNLKYPVGEFNKPKTWPNEERTLWIEIIASFPEALESLLENFTLEMLNTSYRPEGWNGKQVVHHLADSHMNAFIRFKIGMTEEPIPNIRPYREDLWANHVDNNADDLTDSLSILRGLHHRWALFLKSLKEEDFDLIVAHPEYNQHYCLGQLLSMYAWHCEHHLAHLKLILNSAK
jgi:hypothetical protein